MKQFFRLLFVSAAALAATQLTACKKYLDVRPYLNDLMNMDTVFAKSSYASSYLYDIYNYIPDESDFFRSGGTPWVPASDEAVQTWKRSDLPSAYIAAGEYSATSGYYNFWTNLYRGIRSANVFISRVDEVKDMSQGEKQDKKAQARFLRAYFYFCLIQQYGPVIIAPEKPLEFSQSIEDLMLARSTYDSCVNYVAKELTEVAELLPLSTSPTTVGQPTKGAALAVKARLLLYAASPLFNGNTEYGGFRSPTGTPFISQQYDEGKWAQAAAAAKAVIDLNQYDLYTTPKVPETATLPANVPAGAYPEGAGDIDPFLSYRDMFAGGDVLASKNREAIFVRTVNSLNVTIQHCMPRQTDSWNGGGATQKLVDAYYMRDGRTKDNASAAYPYSESGYTSASDAFTRSGVFNMYANREPRFYASIGFTGFFWKGTSAAKDWRKNFVVEYYRDGNEGKAGGDYPVTGYTMMKYIHPEDSYTWEGASRSRKVFMLFRMGEVYLNYVEALNELAAAHNVSGKEFKRDLTEIARYFNRIRFRAGLPGLSTEEMATTASLRTAIRRERQIELAFEGRRYFDTRRWKIAPLEDAKPVTGMNTEITKANKDQFFVRTVAKESIRKFSMKQYLWPIPKSDINKNQSLVQNPGW